MRYTRYEYKRYGKLKFLCSVIIISGLSIGGGLSVGNFIFKGNINFLHSSSEPNKQKQIPALNITAVQCGCYSKKENADKCAQDIKSFCSPFIIEDDSKYRVISGIYKEENTSEILKCFSENKIETSKIKFVVNNNNENDTKYMEVIDGFIAVTSKLQERDVKSIKSSDLKKWADDIIGYNNSDNKLQKIKKCIDNMPEELTKDNISDYSKQMYEIINEK